MFKDFSNCHFLLPISSRQLKDPANSQRIDALDPPRGGAPSGAAEPLARGGMGATAPILWIRFQSPATRTATRTFIRKFRVASGRSRKKIDPRAENLQKSLTRLSNFLKKVRQGSRTFLKLFGKVIGLFKNSSPKLPDFSKNIRQRYRSFWKKCGPKTHISTPDPIRDFPGLSKKYPARLPNFSKIVRQTHRTF